MISFRTALFLYAALAAISFVVLHGPMLKFALILIAALLVKSLLYQYGSKL
jgi:hypothetical protein